MNIPTRPPFVIPKASARALRLLRDSCGLSRPKFALPLLVPADRIKQIEDGTVQDMKPDFWLLALITHDPLIRAKWLKWITTRDAD